MTVPASPLGRRVTLDMPRDAPPRLPAVAARSLDPDSDGLHGLQALVAALIPVALVACSALRDDPAYGVCRAQIVEFVRERLGQSVVRMELDYAERWPPRPRTPPESGRALVYVRECSGYHAFEVRGTEDICEHIPHYGRVSGAYVVYEGGFDGCAG